jgi:hypothetical protein
MRPEVFAEAGTVITFIFIGGARYIYIPSHTECDMDDPNFCPVGHLFTHQDAFTPIRHNASPNVPNSMDHCPPIRQGSQALTYLVVTKSRSAIVLYGLHINLSLNSVTKTVLTRGCSHWHSHATPFRDFHSAHSLASYNRPNNTKSALDARQIRRYLPSAFR